MMIYDATSRVFEKARHTRQKEKSTKRCGKYVRNSAAGQTDRRSTATNAQRAVPPASAAAWGRRQGAASSDGRLGWPCRRRVTLWYDLEAP